MHLPVSGWGPVVDFYENDNKSLDWVRGGIFAHQMENLYPIRIVLRAPLVVSKIKYMYKINEVLGK
jgi:hypothetical protein